MKKFNIKLVIMAIFTVVLITASIIVYAAFSYKKTVESKDVTIGDVEIPKRGSIRLSRNEIITQAHMGNRLISGTDSRGAHATLIIEDKATIKELGFENAIQFSDKRVKDLFDIQDQYEFEERLKEEIQTRAEKYALMVSIYKQGLNDFSKIRFCENYTGYNMDNVKKDDDNKDVKR
jgi:hypothetical protein